MHAVAKEHQQAVRLDIGCGPNKAAGFLGVDRIEFPNVDLVLDVGNSEWPWPSDSVEEVRASHFLEHLYPRERIHFVNQLFRVLQPGGKAQLVTPYWCSNRAYGDLTHQWPPVSEMWFFYLKKEWRLQNAPHTDIAHNPQGYTCDFDATWAYAMHPELIAKNQSTQMHALTFFKEAAQDLVATLVKPVPGQSPS